MKKILIPIAVLLMLFSLAACQGQRIDKDPDYQGSSVTFAPSMIEHYKKEPADIQELVNRSRTVVVGSISSVGELINEPPYNAEDFEDLPEDERPTVEVTYYDISIEEVLLDDGYVRDNARLRLAAIWPTDPQLNKRYVFALDRNPDNLSYGISATWDMLILDGEAITDLDGVDPGYERATTETDLLAALRTASESHVFKPMIEWPDKFADESETESQERE